MGVLPDVIVPGESDPSAMIRAADEYWDSDRASYEDELNAWRERMAASVAVAVAPALRRSEARLPDRRPVAVAVARNARFSRHRSRSVSRGASVVARAR
jgi:predicted signal transduction protein with EAL and GGDEF domain